MSYSNDVYRPEDAEELSAILDDKLKRPPPAPAHPWIIKRTPTPHRILYHNKALEFKPLADLDAPDDLSDDQKIKYYSEALHVEQAHQYEVLWHMLAINPNHTTKTLNLSRRQPMPSGPRR
jgi:hypothetical protein